MGQGQITAQQETIRQKVLTKLWDYVDENFHKFTEANKLKVVVALCSKSMPQIVEGSYSVTKMPTVKIDGKEQELDLGSRIADYTPSSN
jgi:Cys-tRNA synthase (O-phospho-L-seryl-tRNA:Cys-tRNA synthase)